MKIDLTIEEIENIFDDTISWYKVTKTEIRSRLLKDILTKNINELQNIQKIALSCLKEAKRKSEERTTSRNDWMQILLDNQNSLKTLEKNIRSLTDKQVRKEYQSLINQNKKIIESNRRNINSLKNLWETEEKNSQKAVSEIIDLIKVLVSLNVKKVTFNRVIESGRVIITSTPGISNIFSILNGTYDLAKIWLMPIKNTRDTDKFLLWLEHRQEMLNYLNLQLIVLKPFF